MVDVHWQNQSNTSCRQRRVIWNSTNKSDL